MLCQKRILCGILDIADLIWIPSHLLPSHIRAYQNLHNLDQIGYITSAQ
jgi:hypothetical protein